MGHSRRLALGLCRGSTGLVTLEDVNEHAEDSIYRRTDQRDPIRIVEQPTRGLDLLSGS